jgi:hypothetical protein
MVQRTEQAQTGNSCCSTTTLSLASAAAASPLERLVVKGQPGFLQNSSSCAIWKNSKATYNLDFVKGLVTPAGGGQCLEYASGTSPYRTDSQRQQERSDGCSMASSPFNKPCNAWDGYKTIRLWARRVQPQSKQGTNHLALGVTLVDSLGYFGSRNMHDNFNRPAIGSTPSVTTRMPKSPSLKRPFDLWVDCSAPGLVPGRVFFGRKHWIWLDD